MFEEAFEEAVKRLHHIRGLCEQQLEIKAIQDIKTVIDARDGVLERYQPMFSLNNLSALTSEEFQGFLNFKNNRHWSGLHRQGPRICQDMDSLRRALLGLHDHSRPIDARWNTATGTVKHLGKATLCAVLHIMYPQENGVWNQTSEDALKRLRIWPDFDRGTTQGHRYKQINGLLHDLAKRLEVDLWVLDALMWGIKELQDDEETELKAIASLLPDSGATKAVQTFGLEKYLHEFLRDNWEATELDESWVIYEVDGEEVGYKFDCPGVGQMDLLARHKNGRDWLVIELKRDQSSDTTVGQLLRYMGYVRHKLSSSDDRVFGLIIAGSADEKLHYAVSNLVNVAVHTYEVKFTLGSASKNNGSIPFVLLTLDDISARP
jgi:hypothetical protein